MKPSPTTPPDSPGGAPSAASPVRPGAVRAEIPPVVPLASPSAADTASGAMLAPAAPVTPGPTRARPPVPARPTLPPGLRLPYDANGREWRRPPRQAGAAAATSGGAGSAAPPAASGGPGTTPAQAGVPAVASADRPPLLGQAAPALPSRPVSVAPQSGRPHSGGLPDRAPGSLVKDPGSKRHDAHTQLVWAAKTNRKHDTAL